MDQEQRSAPRVDVEPDFSVLRTSSGERFLAVVYDISRAGALVDMSQNDGRQRGVGVGEEIRFLDVPDYLQAALHDVKGLIIRRDEFCWGVQFLTLLALSQPEIDRLREHMEVPVGPDWSKF